MAGDAGRLGVAERKQTGDMMEAEEEAAGLAALSVCESLVIAVVEKGLLTVEETRGVLEDAAAAHQRQDMSASGGRHEIAVRIIERLILQVDAAGHDSRRR